MTEDTMPCTECREPIDVEASKCPHCGSRVVTTGAALLGAFMAVPVLMAVTFFAALFWEPFIIATIATPIIGIAYVATIYRRRQKQLGEGETEAASD